jgi:uncharacterized DUF497 family protein
MPVYKFFWYDENLEHVDQHGVTPEEFEAIVQKPTGVEESRSSDRLIAFGYGDDGRKLGCVYEMLDDLTVFPITAYEVEDE